MPHQCIRCNTFHEDGSDTILKGCPCGSKLFFFIRKDRLIEMQAKQALNLSSQARKEMETDILDIVGANNSDHPVVLDLENIRVLQPGKYELDLVNLFRNEPVVFRLEEGKYVIDIVETFDRLKAEKSKAPK